MTCRVGDERSPLEPRGNPELGYRDTARSSHELLMESRAKVEPGSGKHSVYTHFPKDPNSDICLKTKIKRASCRRRAGTVVPRAENFGDLITADHKVLREECESHHNHRCAVVVQDLATQWSQSYRCNTKTSQETQKSLMKFLEPTRKPKVIYTDYSLEFGKTCEDLPWNHCTSTPHRSETNGIAERGVRRVKEGTFVVLLQSGLDNEWWADSMECHRYLRNIQDLLSDGKSPYERRYSRSIVWDVGGEDETRPLRRHYDHGENGLIYAFDSNSQESRVDRGRKTVKFSQVQFLIMWWMQRVPMGQKVQKTVEPPRMWYMNTIVDMLVEMQMQKTVDAHRIPFPERVEGGERRSGCTDQDCLRHGVVVLSRSRCASQQGERNPGDDLARQHSSGNER